MLTTQEFHEIVKSRFIIRHPIRPSKKRLNSSHGSGLLSSTSRLFLSSLILVLCVLPVTVAASLPDWPMAKYDSLHTAQCPHIGLRSNPQIKWTYNNPAGIYGVVIGGNDKIVIYSGYDKMLRILNRDRAVLNSITNVTSGAAFSSDNTLYFFQQDTLMAYDVDMMVGNRSGHGKKIFRVPPFRTGHPHRNLIWKGATV